MGTALKFQLYLFKVILPFEISNPKKTHVASHVLICLVAIFDSGKGASDQLKGYIIYNHCRMFLVNKCG